MTTRISLKLLKFDKIIFFNKKLGNTEVGSQLADLFPLGKVTNSQSIDIIVTHIFCS